MPGETDMAAALASLTIAVRENTEAVKASTAARSPATAAPRATGSTGGPSGAVFPNYGRSKGQLIKGASAGDLSYYEDGANRTLGDSSKARFHDNERRLIAAINAERARQAGTIDTQAHDGFPDGPGDFGPPGDDSDRIPF